MRYVSPKSTGKISREGLGGRGYLSLFLEPLNTETQMFLDNQRTDSSDIYSHEGDSCYPTTAPDLSICKWPLEDLRVLVILKASSAKVEYDAYLLTRSSCVGT